MPSSATSRRARRTALLLLLAGGLAAVLFRLSAAPDTLVTFTGATMGTTYTVRVAADLSDAERADARRAIDETLAAIDESMSTWRPDSELSRFNADPSTDPRQVSGDLLAVLRLAHDVSRASGGAFDVTVGPLVDAWGFGPGRVGRPFEPPDPETLARLRATLGFERLQVDAESGTIAKTTPELQVDLSAVAKGYGVDRVAESLVALGHDDLVVEIGGEVVARGDRHGTPWRVGIEWPEPGPRRLYGRIELRDAALATSGSYRNFIEHEGQTYSHTIDPRTGRPVTHRLVSVSVVAATCAEADAWATALAVLGPERGFELADQRELAALLIWFEDDGELVSRATPGFEARVVE